MAFNWWTFLIQAINFVVLAYVLHRLLYRPLRDAIDERREANERAQAEAAKARQEAQFLQQQLQQQLVTTEQQRQELIHQAREQGESERQKLLVDAEQKTLRQQEEVRQALQHERDEALQSLRGEVIDQAIGLTRRLLSEASDRSLHEQLVRRLIATLQQLPDAEREHLRANLHMGDGSVLESAEELDPHTLEQIVQAASAIAGQPVSFSVQRRPELLGGVRLRLGGSVWDGSLAGQLVHAHSAAGGNGQP